MVEEGGVDECEACQNHQRPAIKTAIQPMVRRKSENLRILCPGAVFRRPGRMMKRGQRGVGFLAIPNEIDGGQKPE